MASLDQFCFRHNYNAKLFNPSGHLGACGRSLLVSGSKVSLNSGYGLHSSLPRYRLAFFLSSEGGNIYIPVLTCDEKIRTPLSKQNICKKLDYLNIYITNSFHASHV